MRPSALYNQLTTTTVVVTAVYEQNDSDDKVTVTFSALIVIVLQLARKTTQNMTPGLLLNTPCPWPHSTHWTLSMNIPHSGTCGL